MADRIPIGTIPGVTSQLEGVNILIATLGVACTVTRVMLRQTDYDDSGATNTSLTASIRNAVDGGGDGLSVIINNQTQSKTVAPAAPLVVDADESIYLWVAPFAGSDSAMNLTGWIEISGAAGATTALTTLVRVKEVLNIAGSDDDDRLNTLIAAVSGEIQKAIGRKIIQGTATNERVDSDGSNKIDLREYPIISIASLTENDAALVEDTGFEIKEQDKKQGQVARISGGKAANWARGTRVITATYDYGYATVPQELNAAATRLVAFAYNEEKDGGSRMGLRGKTLPTGGSSDYLTRGEVWDAIRPTLDAYRRMWV